MGKRDLTPEQESLIGDDAYHEKKLEELDCQIKFKKKMLCPRWGYCRAIKGCPLSKEVLVKYRIYVRGKCANKDVQIFKSSLVKGD